MLEFAFVLAKAGGDIVTKKEWNVVGGVGQVEASVVQEFYAFLMNLRTKQTNCVVNAAIQRKGSLEIMSAG